MSESSIPSWIRLTISFVILLIASGGAYQLYKMKERPEDDKKGGNEITITAQEVQRYQGDIGIEVSGLVVPFREMTIASEVTGRVIKKTEACRPGRFVKAGEILVVVDQKDYKLEVERIQASLAQAESSVLENKKEVDGAKQLADIAQKEYELQQKDYLRKENSGGAFSASEMNQLRRQVLSAQSAAANQKNRLDVLLQSRSRIENSLQLQRVQLEQANIKLKRCVIQAPVDGVVVTEDVEENGFVQQGATVIKFEDTSKAEIRCNLRPKQLQWLRENAAPEKLTQRDIYSAYRIPKVPVKVRVKNDQEQLTWMGTLDRYDGIGVDEKTKTIPCRIVVPKPVIAGNAGPKALVRGMFVKIDIDFPTVPMAARNQYFTSIPSKGLLPGKQIRFVKDGKLVARKVSVVDNIMESGEEHIVIRLSGEGIQLGDWAVVSPVGNVNATTTIKIRDARNPDKEAVAYSKLSGKKSDGPSKKVRPASNNTPKNLNEKRVSNKGEPSTTH